MSILYPIYKVMVSVCLAGIRILDRLGLSLIPHLSERIYHKDKILSDKEYYFWFHAASLGEVRGIYPLIKKYADTYPDKNIIITTTSATGVADAKKLLPQALVLFAPVDAPQNVRNFLAKYNPRTLYVAETELWPSLIKESSNAGVVLYLINARISDKTFSKYYFFKAFFSSLLECFTRIFAQSNKDVDRIKMIGVDETKITLSYSTKFDFPVQASNNFTCWWNTVFDKNLKTSPLVIAFGSVRASDEMYVKEAILKLRRDDAETTYLCIVVPRHPERFEAFYNELIKTGLRVEKISQPPQALKDVDVLYVDRMGDLLGVYEVSDVCFVGGTFGNVGGHNVLEPAYYGKPIVSGKSIHNIEEVADLLFKKGALEKVETGAELAEKIISITKDLSLKERMTSASRDVYNSLRGSSSNIFNIIQTSLLLCFFMFQGCSPIKGYSGPELPEEQLTTLYYDSCDSNILHLRSSVGGIEFHSSGIELLPGLHTVDSSVEFPQPPFNCIASYYFDQSGYEQCLFQRNQAIVRNRKYIPLCNYSDYQRTVQNCQQSFRLYLCTLSVKLDKALEYNLCVYANSGFVRAKITTEEKDIIQNEVECSYVSEQTRNVQL